MFVLPWIASWKCSLNHFACGSSVFWRLHQSDDCQDLSKYPVITGTGPLRQIKCRVCRSHLAWWLALSALLSNAIAFRHSFCFLHFSWLTYNSPVSPEDPCFFCETCFRMLHYDSSGQRTVADFRAFKYPSALRHRDPFKTWLILSLFRVSFPSSSFLLLLLPMYLIFTWHWIKYLWKACEVSP